MSCSHSLMSLLLGFTLSFGQDKTYTQYSRPQVIQHPRCIPYDSLCILWVRSSAISCHLPVGSNSRCFSPVSHQSAGLPSFVGKEPYLTYLPMARAWGPSCGGLIDETAAHEVQQLHSWRLTLAYKSLATFLIRRHPRSRCFSCPASPTHRYYHIRPNVRQSYSPGALRISIFRLYVPYRV
ncbi:hypothetical protein F5Y06DRAFT_19529 [Hypoxylon sp. FL0890]|nr:hypothetical protein F5Y06DRAFT_19529 [Hypoxylon sp. FL0890]